MGPSFIRHLILSARDLPPRLGDAIDVAPVEIEEIRRFFPLVGRWRYGRAFTEGELNRMRRALRLTVETLRLHDALEPFVERAELEPIRARVRLSLYWACSARLGG